MHFPGVSSKDQPEQTGSALACPPAGLISSPLPSLGRERASVPVCRCLPKPKPGPSHHSPVLLALRSCFLVLERNLSPSRLGADPCFCPSPACCSRGWQCCLQGLAHPIPAAQELSLNLRDPPGAAELPLLQTVYQSDSSPLQTHSFHPCLEPCSLLEFVPVLPAAFLTALCLSLPARKRQLSPQSKSSSKVTSVPGKASEPGPTGAKTGKSSTLSRREELLKQLKAVEDAIARKRAKIPGKV